MKKESIIQLAALLDANERIFHFRDVFLDELSLHDLNCLLEYVHNKNVRLFISILIRNYYKLDTETDSKHGVDDCVTIHNQPVPVLLEWFNDSRSGKKREAAKQLRQRFLHLNYEDQLTVMDLFIDRSVSYRKWAYKMLLEWREPRFDDKLIELWNIYHERACAWTMIKQFPTGKLLPLANSIVYELYEKVEDDRNRVGGGFYYTLCSRLKDENDFVINPKYLMECCRPENFIKLMKQKQLTIPEETCRKYLYDYLVEQLNGEDKPLVRQDPSGRTCFSLCGGILNSMLSLFNSMGYFNFVMSFLQWERVIVKDFFVTNLNELTFQKISKGEADAPFAEYVLERIPENFRDIPEYSLDVTSDANNVYENCMDKILNPNAQNCPF